MCWCTELGDQVTDMGITSCYDRHIKTEGGIHMNVILDEKLKEYMDEKNQRDIVLEIEMCNT